MTSRVPQLDGLRAIAVLLVVLHHWLEGARALDLGNIGVQLFFVLSGYLITRILHEFRDRRANGELGIGEVLVRFHLSRAARIWPVALLTVSLVWMAGDRFDRREDMLWHALFASNLLFFQRGEFASNLAHFWSLAVEQQFYLVWPLVVLLIPARLLKPMVLAFVVAAPVLRLALVAMGFTRFAQYNVLPFANFDSLGMGALVALWSRYPVAIAQAAWRLLGRVTLAAVLALLALRFASAAVGAEVPANPEQSLYSIAFAWLVAHCARGMGGLAGRVLSWRPLVFLGVISYGIYVYHMFAPRAVGTALRVIGIPEEFHGGVLLFALSAALTMSVAALSWVLMERPILAWRQMLAAPRVSTGVVGRAGA
jgi:peptidoglycan/LPS O-acetylase OafA/YrhL